MLIDVVIVFVVVFFVFGDVVFVVVFVVVFSVCLAEVEGDAVQSPPRDDLTEPDEKK